jgi:hypothetical protein
MLLGPGLPDLRRFRVELLDEAPGVVAVTDQPRFEIIELMSIRLGECIFWFSDALRPLQSARSA